MEIRKFVWGIFGLHIFVHSIFIVLIWGNVLEKFPCSDLCKSRKLFINVVGTGNLYFYWYLGIRNFGGILRMSRALHKNLTWKKGTLVPKPTQNETIISFIRLSINFHETRWVFRGSLWNWIRHKNWVWGVLGDHFHIPKWVFLKKS